MSVPWEKYNIFFRKSISIPKENKYLILLIKKLRRENQRKLRYKKTNSNIKKMIIDPILNIDNKKYKLFSGIFFVFQR